MKAEMDRDMEYMAGEGDPFIFGTSIGANGTEVGLSGGLLLMWKEELQVHVFSSSLGHIVAEVARQDFLPWTLTYFYRHPNATQRKFLWQLLRNIKSEVHRSWLRIGDFNEIVSLAEKTGARTIDWISLGAMSMDQIKSWKG
ncbi:hypothetical protein F8388_020461 [Cannabis sativa]|uniref:Uncharacterized protein n=1 Tax=Cannabis sativa TaxID=3483 RepID=A0A7J6E253_CANSA|nr:hypothetical protein F8388_020461 [Cannabis sativa]KAF4400535.1 hypothetical protein G4B88_023328 [Cannabis sativa]